MMEKGQVIDPWEWYIDDEEREWIANGTSSFDSFEHFHRDVNGAVDKDEMAAMQLADASLDIHSEIAMCLSNLNLEDSGNSHPLDDENGSMQVPELSDCQYTWSEYGVGHI